MVTGSLEAWRAYASGMECFERSFAAESSASCLDDMKRAVAIDPGFALAQLHTSVLLYLSGAPRALQQEALRMAESNPDRLPPHDRGRLAGWAAFLAGRDAEAKALLLSAAESTPADRIAWYLAGELPYHRDEFGEALPVFKRIHALFPTWAYTTHHLIFSLGVAGRSAGLRALASELDDLGEVAGAVSSASYARLWFEPASAATTCQRAMPADGAEADACLAVALLNLGARDQLAAHLAAMGERERKRDPKQPYGFAWYMRFMLLGQEGRWSEVERTMQAAGDLENAWYHVTSAELIAGAGDPAPVGREAMRILELNRALASSLAVHLAYLGDLRRAAELESYLPAGSPRVDVYRALVQWRGGDLPGAIKALRAVADQAPVSAAPPIPPPLYLLGEALAEAGQDAEAVRVLRRYRAIPMTYPTWFWPRSQWFLARSLDRLGDQDGAREVLAPLLELWKGASENQPHLAEARALGRRLGMH
jgi:eukaryotic-like serine/threonine-protein kinase